MGFTNLKPYHANIISTKSHQYQMSTVSERKVQKETVDGVIRGWMKLMSEEDLSVTFIGSHPGQSLSSVF